MYKELLVAALENGTVIDHIPSEKLFDVIRLLGLEVMDSSVTIGYNLKSKKMGNKSIIKVADKIFSDAQISSLAVVAPSVVLNIIAGYEVVQKKRLSLPEELVEIIKCPNPQCITNNEPMRTHFRIVNKERGVVKCRYCEKSHPLAKAKLCNR